MRGTNKPMNYKNKAKFAKSIRLLNCEKPAEALKRFLDRNRVNEVILPLINKVYKENYSSVADAFKPNTVVSNYLADRPLCQSLLMSTLHIELIVLKKVTPINSEYIELIKLLEVLDYMWHLSVVKFKCRQSVIYLNKGKETFLNNWDSKTNLEDI